MNEHTEIILEALEDYRCWFTDQGGDLEELIADKEKVKKIDAAIEYIRKGALS